MSSLAPTRSSSAIDTDGDGLISVEEAEAYDKKLHDAAEKK